MAQQLISEGNSVCSGFTPAGFTAAGFTPVGSVPSSVTAEELLQALPPEASPALREAIESGCCIHYTVAEGMCGAGGCGTGSCCYHAVSTGCSINQYECLPYPCSKGNFSTGC
jgi:hypothetical protein